MSSCGSFGRAYLWSRVKIRPVRGWYPSAPGEGKFTEKHAKFRDCARQPVHQVERFLSEWFGEWPGNTKICSLANLLIVPEAICGLNSIFG